jgi:hypothetical protein
LRIEHVLGLSVASPIALTDGPDTKTGTCDVRFRLEGEALQGEVAISDRIEIRTLDDAPYLQMGRVPAGFFLRFPGWADFVVSHDGAAISCAPAPGIPIDTVRHLLISQIIPRAMGLLRDPALHASGVGRDDAAVGFIGATGHGKSTLALSFARAGWTLLGDDCLLLRPLEKSVEVVPSRMGVRLWPDSAEGLLGGTPSLPTVAHYTDKLRWTTAWAASFWPSAPYRCDGCTCSTPRRIRPLRPRSHPSPKGTPSRRSCST